jgi:beta-galactosidase/beta-glucuronidase
LSCSNNRIRTIALVVRRLTAVEAEIWVQVEVERITPTTEVRGKLLGPRCPGVTTVEIAYALQAMPRAPRQNNNTIVMRAIIDEPNLWTAKTPFVYEGFAELYEDGHCQDRAPVSVGLKLA